jgi:hypothetical protein
MSYPTDNGQFNLTAEDCEPNSLEITDDPILYGIRENLEGIAVVIESCLQEWSFYSFRRLQLVRLTAPDYKVKNIITKSILSIKYRRSSRLLEQAFRVQ